MVLSFAGVVFSAADAGSHNPGSHGLCMDRGKRRRAELVCNQQRFTII